LQQGLSSAIEFVIIQEHNFCFGRNTVLQLSAKELGVGDFRRLGIW